MTSYDLSKKWLFEPNGELVGDGNPTGWDLADGINRLNIADGATPGDVTSRTPPTSGMTSMAPLNDTSPLEHNSSNSSPHSGQQLDISHSRGSSTDTTSQDSAGNTLTLKTANLMEQKERPHSFSGGISTADLRRLQTAGDGPDDGHLQQQQQWASSLRREGSSDQQGELPYPSLLNSKIPGPRSAHPDFATRAPQLPLVNKTNREDYNAQQRPAPVNPPTMASGLPNTGQHTQYRQQGPGFQPPPTIPQSPTYPVQHGHTLSLGNTQQLYDMMLPGAVPDGLNPLMNRIQQQQFRGNHHHSSSDPSALRDAATLALLNMPGFNLNPGMYGTGLPGPQGMPMYPGAFYGQQDFSRPAVAAAAQAAMAARLQQQFNGSYGMVVAPPQLDAPLASPSASSAGGAQNGPSANNRKLGLYKTELCRSWEEKGTCRYGQKCQFAHGEEELRKVSRHPKYKTEICRTFWVSGSCPYGKRCCFIHTELPASGGATNSASTETPSPGQPRTGGRARSTSTNSDPNDGSVSLLSRISKRTQEVAQTPSASTPVDSPTSFNSQRPPTGSLRVDTALDGASMKQNKSAYPSFARNGVLLPAPERIKTKSPAPVTAGPDLGRHNAARLEIVGYNTERNTKSTTPPSNATSGQYYNNSDENFNSSSNGPSYGVSSGDGNSTSGNTPPRANGHVRSGSAGNWPNLRGSHLASGSFPSPVGDAANSPWSTTELAVGSSRLNDKAW